MSKINITYYNQLKDIIITTYDISDIYCDFYINVTDRTNIADEKLSFDLNRKIDLSNFFITITEKNNKFPEISFPKEDEVLLNTDQFQIYTQRILWKADDVIEFKVKLGDIEKDFIINIPRPEKPFESWNWLKGEWTPPVLMPNDGNRYIWNEEKFTWQII
jgi:hypothetical protein